MFELTKDLLDKIGRAIMPDAELVPVGPHFEAPCAACTGTCKNGCQGACKGSCKSGCTRTCKGNSR